MLSTQQIIDKTNKLGAHNYHPKDVVIVEGEGVIVRDPEGREYFDMLSAYSALNFGHRHPEIVAAAKAAYAHGFIKRLPQGYDTLIGESDGNISQGQKQLLCIARVMLTRPPMLILDEATSSIDTRTEVRVQKAFAAMMEGRTSFVVAHRLSTIRSADCILVMRDGRIIERGTHEQLMAADGFYRQLYNSQFDTSAL